MKKEAPESARPFAEEHGRLRKRSAADERDKDPTFVGQLLATLAKACFGGLLPRLSAFIR